jgi:hydroxymethylpyrimidine pyrophosphatase-like HAD family hydrolase
MTFDVLATDYDGTIAHDGRVDDTTLEALRQARDEGLRLILVTGREVPDLANTFAHFEVFDRIVAENGGVLLDPRSQALATLTVAPPPELLEWLTARAIPISVGHSIVATVQPHEDAVREALRVLALPWEVVLNKGAVMVLPIGISKRSGLERALRELGGAAFERTVGVGDAENDRAFLEVCGLSVAVANALESVKAAVDWVTEGKRGAGVAELIARWRSGDLAAIAAAARERAAQNRRGRSASSTS